MRCNVDFLRGKTLVTPYHHGPILADHESAVAALLTINRAGLITVDGQSGKCDSELRQKSFVEAIVRVAEAPALEKFLHTQPHVWFRAWSTGGVLVKDTATNGALTQVRESDAHPWKRVTGSVAKHRDDLASEWAFLGVPSVAALFERVGACTFLVASREYCDGDAAEAALVRYVKTRSLKRRFLAAIKKRVPPRRPNSLSLSPTRQIARSPARPPARPPAHPPASLMTLEADGGATKPGRLGPIDADTATQPPAGRVVVELVTDQLDATFRHYDIRDALQRAAGRGTEILSMDAKMRVSWGQRGPATSRVRLTFGLGSVPDCGALELIIRESGLAGVSFDSVSVRAF